MKCGTKEFYEAIAMFEKVVKTDYSFNTRLDKLSNETMMDYSSRGNLIVFENGETNKLFLMFLHGIETGRMLYSN